jgi:hypothetical protein
MGVCVMKRAFSTRVGIAVLLAETKGLCLWIKPGVTRERNDGTTAALR